MNPNTPVLVGVAQVLQRDADPASAKQPLDLMLDAIKAAAEDSGQPGLLSGLDSVRVVRGIWRYKNPAGYLAEALGVAGVETYGTPFGGNSVQSLVNRSALDILAGDRELIVMTGGEFGRTQAKAAKAGIELSFRDTGDGSYDKMLGDEAPMASEPEMARGIRAPIQIYPILKNAIRYQRGESIEAHLQRISELWAGFADVARGNPHAWIQDGPDAATIRTPSAANRMVSFPYPKLMNSNNAVDMGAALIMTSVAKAEALGIARDKWVFPWTGTDAHDHYFVSEREDLHSSPAIRFAGRKALELAGLQPENVDLVDVYSCFPSAVQVGASEIGLSLDRPLTITGGLTFGGGPLNNYVMHSIARMVELCRTRQDDKGLITANGGYLTKHAFGVYSATPPEQDFQYADLQAEVDSTPRREGLVDFAGEVVIESYTVMYDGEGPAVAHAACLTAEGQRTFANCSDRDIAGDMTRNEFCGRRATINGSGDLSVQ